MIGEFYREIEIEIDFHFLNFSFEMTKKSNFSLEKF
jgi:hypothetical protein